MTYILQTRDAHGFIKTIAKFDEPISQQQVQEKYGSGSYCVKETSPRFKVLWKGTVGKAENSKTITLQRQELQGLIKKIDYLTIGEGLLAVGEVVGFGATALSLADHSTTLNRAELTLRTQYRQNQMPFICPACGHQLYDLLDNYCGDCGTKIAWPSKREAVEPTGQQCPYCSFPVRSGQQFCRECGSPPAEGRIVFRRIP